MLLFMCCMLFSISNYVICQELLNKTENTYSRERNFTTDLKNDTKTNTDHSLPVQRITQPSPTHQIQKTVEPSRNFSSVGKKSVDDFRPRLTQFSQTQQIERTVEPSRNLSNNGKKSFSNFRPSPQLDVQYEYNKFPVIPAFPEAKHSGNEVKLQNTNEYYGDRYSTTEYPWTSKVRFPSNEKERPYQFYSENNEPPLTYAGKNSHSYPVKNEEFTANNNYNFPERHEEFSFNKPVPISPTPFYGNGRHTKYPPQHKTYGYNLMERPSSIHKTNDYGIGHYDKNPWKKIIKILAAFIPIGLIISALTPTVITVTNTNDTNTQSRYRLDDKNMDLKQKVLSSIAFFEGLQEKGCEERIICELLLAASTSPNAKENVKNFLDNFSEQKDIAEKTEDLKKIFAAVRNQDCKEIVCENIQNTT